jgi:hypothetical protein
MSSYYKQMDNLTKRTAQKVKEEGGTIKCGVCRSVFHENENGESDTGVKRPQCPACTEELDLEFQND